MNVDPFLIFVFGQQFSFSFVHSNKNVFVFVVYASTSNVFVFIVYACNSYVLRCQRWSHLQNLQDLNKGSLLFIRDFNTILGAHEKTEGLYPNKNFCDDFRLWTNSYDLIHLEF